MQELNLINIFRQMLNPYHLYIMVKKIILRFSDSKGKLNNKDNICWIEDNLSSYSDFAEKIDSNIWLESMTYAKHDKVRAEKILRNIEYDLGGGGLSPLLYFITRIKKPEVIVETGIAAGFSSNAFLKAIKCNGNGFLYSSDFPYFRIKNPEKYIGIVVEEYLKDGWQFYVDGDELNLPRIVKDIRHIDLFHYDSDKSYTGRRYAIKVLSKYLTGDSVIVMDDIQDNSFFHDYIIENKIKNWKIFKFEGKYVGLIGEVSK